MSKKRPVQLPRATQAETKPSEVNLCDAFRTRDLEAFRQALAIGPFRLSSTNFKSCTLFDAALGRDLEPITPNADNTPLLIALLQAEHHKSGLHNLIEFEKFVQGLLERGQIQYDWDVMQAYMSGKDHTILHDYNIDLCATLIPIVSSSVLHQLLKSLAGLSAGLEVLADLPDADQAIRPECIEKLHFVSMAAGMTKTCIGDGPCSLSVRENTIRRHNHQGWLSLPLSVRLTCALDSGDISWLMVERDHISLAHLRARISRDLSTLQSLRSCTLAKALLCYAPGPRGDSDERTLVDIE